MAEQGSAEAGAAPSEDGTPVPDLSALDDQMKIPLHFQAVGQAPILAKAQFKNKGSTTFRQVQAFLHKKLELKFCYVGSAFAPAPDQSLGDLYRSFATGKKLIVHYSLQEVWG